MPISYLKPERLLMRAHADLTEKWVQSIIAQDPSILGLGDLVLRDQERVQPRAGRLDLLLQDPESKRRYEVELQLGSTDETHIIRTIEYWDIERKRYPQYEHCAVIVAEDITSRFLNVISLFNGSIPLIAIQMQALKVGEHTTLVFTTVIDELTRGLVDEDEEAEAAPTDRSHWESKTSRQSVAIADELLRVVKDFDPALELNFTKFYIGLHRDRRAYNFVTFRPNRNHFVLEIKLPKSDDIDAKIEAAGIETLEYNRHWSSYRLRLVGPQVREKIDVIRELMHLAYEERRST